MTVKFRIYANGKLIRRGKKKTVDKCLTFRPQTERGLMQGDTMRVVERGRKPVWYWYHADVDLFRIHLDTNQPNK